MKRNSLRAGYKHSGIKLSQCARAREYMYSIVCEGKAEASGKGGASKTGEIVSRKGTDDLDFRGYAYFSVRKLSARSSRARAICFMVRVNQSFSFYSALIVTIISTP